MSADEFRPGCLEQQKNEEILEKSLARKFHLECIKNSPKFARLFQESAQIDRKIVSHVTFHALKIFRLQFRLLVPERNIRRKMFLPLPNAFYFIFCLTFIRPRAKRYARDLPIIGASCPRSQINGKLASRRLRVWPRAQASNGCAIVIRITLSNDFDNCRH